MSAAILVQPLAWDTEFLGFPVARLSATGHPVAALTAAVADARRAGYRLVYIVTDPGHTAAAALARQTGAWLADRRLTFVRPLPAPDPSAVVAPAIGATTAFTARLEALAWQSGEFSRFRLDKRLAPTVFRRLYSQWLRNSLTGEIARQVLTWRNDAGHELGLLTLGEKNNRADIGLLAVDATARGLGLGRQLVAAAQAQAAAWGYAELQVVTQRANAPAGRFYEKCGFALVREELVYHLWLA